MKRFVVMNDTSDVSLPNLVVVTPDELSNELKENFLNAPFRRFVVHNTEMSLESRITARRVTSQVTSITSQDNTSHQVTSQENHVTSQENRITPNHTKSHEDQVTSDQDQVTSQRNETHHVTPLGTTSHQDHVIPHHTSTKSDHKTQPKDLNIRNEIVNVSFFPTTQLLLLLKGNKNQPINQSTNIPIYKDTKKETYQNINEPNKKRIKTETNQNINKSIYNIIYKKKRRTNEYYIYNNNKRKQNRNIKELIIF